MKNPSMYFNHLNYRNMSTFTEAATEIAAKVADATEKTIMHQINDFISRGLIVVEQVGPTFIREPNEDKITVRTAVRLVLKDKEYIEKLEKDLEDYKSMHANQHQQLMKIKSMQDWQKKCLSLVGQIRFAIKGLRMWRKYGSPANISEVEEELVKSIDEFKDFVDQMDVNP